MASHAQALVQRLKLLPQNRECADCHEKRPDWASSKLGIFICLQCSGIHRNLGTHISFVRSCNLDSWTEEQANVMRAIGNKRANEYWEYNLPPHFQRPPNTNRPAMEDFIKRKYVDREWANPRCKAPNELPLTQCKTMTDDEIQNLINEANAQEASKNAAATIDDNALLDEIDFAPKSIAQEITDIIEEAEKEREEDEEESESIKACENDQQESFINRMKKRSEEIMDIISEKMSQIKLFTSKSSSELEVHCDDKQTNNEFPSTKEVIEKEPKQNIDPLAQNFSLFSDDETDDTENGGEKKNNNSDFDFLYDTDHLKEKENAVKQVENNKNDATMEKEFDFLFENEKENQRVEGKYELGDDSEQKIEEFEKEFDFLLDDEKKESKNEHIEEDEREKNDKKKKGIALLYSKIMKKTKKEKKREEKESEVQKKPEIRQIDEHEFDFLFEDPTEPSIVKNEEEKDDQQTKSDEFDFLFEESKTTPLPPKTEKTKQNKTKHNSLEDLIDDNFTLDFA